MRPEMASRQRRLSGRSIPISIGSAEPQWDSVTGGDVHPDPKGEQWLLLDKCPFCGHGERTVVVEWNKLIMLAKGAGSAVRALQLQLLSCVRRRVCEQAAGW